MSSRGVAIGVAILTGGWPRKGGVAMWPLWPPSAIAEEGKSALTRLNNQRGANIYMRARKSVLVQARTVAKAATSKRPPVAALATPNDGASLATVAALATPNDGLAERPQPEQQVTERETA